MKNRNGFYALCFTVVALILVVLVIFSGNTSLFGRHASVHTEAVVPEMTGDVSLRRKSSNYTLKEGTALEDGDMILVGRNSSCTVSLGGETQAVLDRDTTLQLEKTAVRTPACEVREGTAFFTAGDGAFTVKAGEAQIIPEGEAAFSVEAYFGAETVKVYKGRVRLSHPEGEYILEEAQHAAVTHDSKQTSIEVGPVLVSELQDFLLRQLIGLDGLCYEPSILEGILADRGSLMPKAPEATAEDRMTCKVEIRCDALTVTAGLSIPGIPEDGILFAAAPVKFTRGETVFDVLKRICQTADIPLDYKYTEINQGYYVSEIMGLRELAYGQNAGWLYQVNGWYPNYISSRYEISEGDVIVWAYTTNGGVDLGREDWTGQGHIWEEGQARVSMVRSGMQT